MFKKILKNGLKGSQWYKDDNGKHVYNTHADIEPIPFGKMLIAPNPIEETTLSSKIPHDNFERISNDNPGKEYTTSKDLNESTKKEWDNLSEEHKQALQYYTGEGFTEINQLAATKPDLDNSDEQELAKKIKIMDEAAKNMKIPSDNLLYRATDLNYFDHPKIKEVLSTLKDNAEKEDRSEAFKTLKGISFTDPCFGSSSISSDVAKRFNAPFLNNAVILEIAAHKGTSGIWMGDRSEHKNEHEFIMPRNTKYTVVGVHNSEKGLFIQVRITPQ